MNTYFVDQCSVTYHSGATQVALHVKYLPSNKKKAIMTDLFSIMKTS